MTGRAWQRMLSGRRLNIVDPSPLDIEITDIALSLSRVARWNGQTIGDHGFSVAQHSVLVAELMAAAAPVIDTRCMLAGLLHDAPEYVCSDLVTPFKNAIGGGYRELEDRMARAVYVAFGLPAELPAEWADAVVQADRLAAHIEAVQLAGFTEAEAKKLFAVKRNVPRATLTAWPAVQANEVFLDTFADLVAERWPAPMMLGTQSDM